jgi:SpoVK/Ycf46/Vps4 family AAA+-type ATPase
MLLVGVQGCGKSLAARATAALWGLPLLRLDAGRLYDKYIGESEKNLRKVLATAESMAPVVLWIDEIEKAMAGATGSDGDGGLSRRILGSFLTWLQDKAAPVFLVATANDITALPPELLRKGRFDEIFFVDLPDEPERRAIFTIHLQRRQRPPELFDLDALAAASDGFSGAEIEQAVVSSLYAAFSGPGRLTTEILLAELAATRPLSVTMAEKVAAIRAWAAERTVPAN